MFRNCGIAFLTLLSVCLAARTQGTTGLMPPSPGSLSGADAFDGDPVDLYSGLYVRTTTDLQVADTIPIQLSRTYRNDDHRSRAFGVGTSHDYDMFIAGDATAFTYVELILAGGTPIHFGRISPGNGYADGVFEHEGGPGAFDQAKITWNGSGWTVALTDGSSYRLQGCSHNTSSGQCGLIEFRDSNGDALHVQRLPSGDIERIISPHGKWVAFTYDSEHRVVRTEASTGDFVKYEYDAGGRLVRVTPSGQDEPLQIYGYDADDRMIKIIDDGQLISNEYDHEYCIHQFWQSGDDFLEFRFQYFFDAQGQHVATEVRQPNGTLRWVTFDKDGHPDSDAQDPDQPDPQ